MSSSLRVIASLALLLSLCACNQRSVRSDAGTGGDGSTPTGDGSMPTACPGPPAGVSSDAAAALALENQVRTAMGIPCATMVPEINLGATRHCEYYAANQSMSSCVGNPHQEVSSCSMFVAVNFWDRMTGAGYTGQPAGEDMAFQGDGAGAVQQWIDSVWHRTPILSPWERDIGYGKATGCDTMDFGVGADADPGIVATYPYANQTNVPVDFDGRYEGPMPPVPPSGWPSGYPIHVYMQGGSISEHTLTGPGGTALSHTWLTPSDSRSMGLLRNEYVMYSDAPLAAHTQYQVHVMTSHGPLDWSFTTR